jgi:hypothetical protein
MYKQSTYVIALFLGTSQAFIDVPASNNLFATGMNGDEDLGEDITMKGNKFHFNQQPTNFVQVAEEPATQGDAPAKTEVLEPEKVHVLDPKIAKTRTTFYMGQNKAGAEGSTDGYPRPEQVHTLDPMVYTNISNMQGHVLNPSTGFRTAFYDKKNSLWRQDSVSDMQLIQTEETPALHPYNYDPWVYQFSRENIRPYSSHIGEDPEDSRPKTEEEIAALPKNVAKAKKAAEAEAKLKLAKEEQNATVDPMNAENGNPEAKANTEAADDKKLVEAALKKADKALAAPKKKEEAKALAQTEAFYNHEVGLWMYDTTLVQGDDDDEYGPTEKVQSLNPIAYQYWSDTNKTGAFRRARTAFFAQTATNNI